MARTRLTLPLGAAALWTLATAPALASDPEDGTPTQRLSPHPVITEVLFNVPKGDDADANADGTRHSTADEFVELFNPHPGTIDLRGYTITNRLTAFDAGAKRGVRFTFPPFEMEPGAVVVVFNGHGARIPGPVGTAERAPKKPNDHFAGAYVFTMNPSARTNAFSNSGDFALLSDPRGEPIDAVAWNDPDPPPPESARRTETVDKNPKGSVQRVTADASLIAHPTLDGAICSPGTLPAPPAVAGAGDNDANDGE